MTIRLIVLLLFVAAIYAVEGGKQKGCKKGSVRKGKSKRKGKGLAPIGDPCDQACECETNSCYRGNIEPEDPGVCVCSWRTHAGCDTSDGFLCLFESQIPDHAPYCQKLAGGFCQANRTCFSQFCDNSACAVCNPETNHGCEIGTPCVDDPGGGYVCETTDAPDTSFADGGACWNNEECDFICYFPEMHAPGTCITCDPETNEGCEEPATCQISPLYSFATPRCLSPNGAPCQGGEECISDFCDGGTCT